MSWCYRTVINHNVFLNELVLRTIIGHGVKSLNTGKGMYFAILSYLKNLFLRTS